MPLPVLSFADLAATRDRGCKCVHATRTIIIISVLYNCPRFHCFHGRHIAGSPFPRPCPCPCSMHSISVTDDRFHLLHGRDCVDSGGPNLRSGSCPGPLLAATVGGVNDDAHNALWTTLLPSIALILGVLVRVALILGVLV
jgi:hypothetical protein